MGRKSIDEYIQGPHGPTLFSGFDYELQCWVERGIVHRCGHETHCECIGRKYWGKRIEEVRELVLEKPAL